MEIKTNLWKLLPIKNFENNWNEIRYSEENYKKNRQIIVGFPCFYYEWRIAANSFDLCE